MAALMEQSPPGTTAALAVHDLAKTFAAKRGTVVEALHSVSFEALAGHVTGLVGADGAGKTTLIRMAAGLLTPTQGSITLLGLDSVADAVAIQQRVGYMPQKFGLYQDLTVKENMDLYADLQGVPPHERVTRYDQLLQMTGLQAYTRRLAGALSGGMKQKLGLACCLIKSPQMLLLDEPTVGVDPISRRELWKIVYQLVSKYSIGVVVSTAYLDEAERCDWVVVLHEGRKLAEGKPFDFKQRVAGSVILIDPPSGVKPRQIHTHLAGRPHVRDVTIRSGRVRVVLDKPESTALTKSLPAAWQEKMTLAKPNFEDAFMRLVPHKGEHLQVGESAETDSPRDESPDVMVRVKQLQKYFGEFEAVKKIDFEVQRGEIFGLLGPNGAGKSTTFRMLCGLLPVSGGEVSVAGNDLRRSPSRARARIGYMAQQFSLYGQLSVLENLRFFGRAYGLRGRQLMKRIEWAFSEFDLGAWRDQAAVQLPGGYKQRLAMATALLHHPGILFLDEPTSGVDPLARREFWLRINGFSQEGVTVVVTTHFMEESEYCDRILIMSQGESLAIGSPDQIRGLVRSKENPDPTIEDAFIALAEKGFSDSDKQRPNAATGGDR